MAYFKKLTTFSNLFENMSDARKTAINSSLDVIHISEKNPEAAKYIYIVVNKCKIKSQQRALDHTRHHYSKRIFYKNEKLTTKT